MLEAPRSDTPIVRLEWELRSLRCDALILAHETSITARPPGREEAIRRVIFAVEHAATALQTAIEALTE